MYGSNNRRNNAVGTPPNRHHKYYFEDGNAIFLIEDTLFNVHRSILSQEPDTMFSYTFSKFTPWAQVSGTTDDTPFTIPDISKEEFEAMLSALYPGNLFAARRRFLPRDEISTVLRFARRWDMKDLFQGAKWALLETFRGAMSTEVLALAREHDGLLSVDELRGIFFALARRPNPITYEESPFVDGPTMTYIAAARERSKEGDQAIEKEFQAYLQYLGGLTHQRQASSMLGRRFPSRSQPIHDIPTIATPYSKTGFTSSRSSFTDSGYHSGRSSPISTFDLLETPRSVQAEVPFHSQLGPAEMPRQHGPLNQRPSTGDRIFQPLTPFPVHLPPHLFSRGPPPARGNNTTYDPYTNAQFGQPEPVSMHYWPSTLPQPYGWNAVGQPRTASSLSANEVMHEAATPGPGFPSPRAYANLLFDPSPSQALGGSPRPTHDTPSHRERAPLRSALRQRSGTTEDGPRLSETPSSGMKPLSVHFIKGTKGSSGGGDSRDGTTTAVSGSSGSTAREERQPPLEPNGIGSGDWSRYPSEWTPYIPPRPLEPPMFHPAGPYLPRVMPSGPYPLTFIPSMASYPAPITTDLGRPATPFAIGSPGTFNQPHYWMGSTYSAGGGEYGASTGRSPYTPIHSGNTPGSLAPSVMSWAAVVDQYPPVPHPAYFAMGSYTPSMLPHSGIQPSEAPHQLTLPKDTPQPHDVGSPNRSSVHVSSVMAQASTDVSTIVAVEAQRNGHSPSPVYHSLDTSPSHSPEPPQPPPLITTPMVKDT